MTSAPALSPELEDYLESIAALIRDAGKARVQDIAAALSVHKSTVTAALHRLAEKGLIDYRPYVVPTLTGAGREVAARIQRRHDVFKRFLTDVLLVEGDVAEANACRLEHAVDREVMESLVRFVDSLASCPRTGAAWIRQRSRGCGEAMAGDGCERCLEAALAGIREQGASGADNV